LIYKGSCGGLRPHFFHTKLATEIVVVGEYDR
jgi:hypothetical protein